MKITLVRHGETESNYLDICQGLTNILLNDSGRRQCKKLRDSIKEKHFDVCYTSPLVRSVETAMILIGDRVKIIPEKKLIDRDLGEFEGKERRLYDVNKFWDYNLNCNDFGVEPVQNIFKRCSDFLDYIKKKHNNESVLIVCHAATIRAIKHLILKTDLSNSLLYDNIKNCYYEEIEV